jgi:UDP-N-acetylglucosamine 2-epimerase (hydrolysing)
MFSEDLPNIDDVKKYYEILFENFAIVMFHPVTTEATAMKSLRSKFCNCLQTDIHNYIVIYPTTI